MINLMRPEMQKRNVHRIFTAIELNDDGEVVRVNVKPWVSSAFAEVATALDYAHDSYPAEGGGRTHTPITRNAILSRARLPVPPLRPERRRAV